MELEGKSKTLKLVLTAVCTALLAALSQVSFPLPTGIPVTLQTFAVALCGYVLGAKLGVLSVFVYLALGAVGLPVFAGFSAGIATFAGMTGGYLWGFLPMAFLCGLGAAVKSRPAAMVLGVTGMAACHVCGVVQFSLVMQMAPWQAFLAASAPYLVKDAVSVVLGYLAAEAVTFALKKAKVAQ